MAVVREFVVRCELQNNFGVVHFMSFAASGCSSLRTTVVHCELHKMTAVREFVVVLSHSINGKQLMGLRLGNFVV
jgi:hypothetical protein